VNKKVHLSLFFIIPLLLVLFACAPLLIAVMILSQSLLPLWKAGQPVSPDQMARAIRLIAIDLGASGLMALVAGFLIAYAVTQPVTRFKHAFQDIISGKPSPLSGMESSEEFVHLHEAFNRMVSSLKFQSRLAQAERLAALGALAAGVAHEIRNPLGSIRGLAQLLSENSTDAQQKKYAETVMAEADRLNRALEILLHLARPLDRGGVTPPLSKEDINALLHQSVELLAFERKKKDIAVIEQYQPGLPDLSADAEAIRQAFFNILLNAVQAVQPSGKIRVATRRNGTGPIQIEIRNTGPTISPEDLKRIFDPFFTTKEQGTGLGLAITHQVVTAHGGTIEVESGNHETVFMIELPVK
jgi:signal transduction histidine kinase